MKALLCQPVLSGCHNISYRSLKDEPDLLGLPTLHHYQPAISTFFRSQDIAFPSRPPLRPPLPRPFLAVVLFVDQLIHVVRIARRAGAGPRLRTCAARECLSTWSQELVV